MSIKQKVSSMCDKAEAKLQTIKETQQERKEARQKWLEEHPNLEKLAAGTVIVGTWVGIIALAVASATLNPDENGEKEEQSNYSKVLSAVQGIKLDPGERYDFTVNDTGITKIVHTIEPVEEVEEPEEDSDNSDTVISIF